MGKLNIKKVFFGFVLIGLALGLAVVAFYFFEVKPELAAREKRARVKTSSNIKTFTLDEGADRSVVETSPRGEPQQPSSSEENSWDRPASPPSLPSGEEKTFYGKEPASDVKPTSEGVDLSAYSKEEQNRKDGVLWADGNSGKYIATLGAVQGLRAGSRLRVFSGEQQIGEVEVDETSDVVSYVSPVGGVFKNVQTKYFRVLKP